MTNRAGWLLTLGVGAAVGLLTWGWMQRDRLLGPPAPPLARVERVDGEARAGGRPLRAGDTLGAGDRVEAAAAVALVLPSRERVELGAGGSLELMKLARDGSELWLHRGDLAVDAPHGKRATPVVYTREATCAAVGARFSLAASDGTTLLRVTRGAVHVEGLHRTSADVLAGQRLSLTRGDLARPPPPSEPEPDR